MTLLIGVGISLSAIHTAQAHTNTENSEDYNQITTLETIESLETNMSFDGPENGSCGNAGCSGGSGNGGCSGGTGNGGCS